MRYGVGEDNHFLRFLRFRFYNLIIDEIDKVLTKHYGFTEEEFDFIIRSAFGCLP